MERMRSDAEFYREYLRDHPEREHSPFTVGLTALTGLASLYVAYRKGLLRSFAEQAIRVLGSYQSGTFHAISRGIRNWTLREFKDKPPLRYQLALLKSDIRHSLAEHREERLRQLSKPFLTDKPGEILRLLGQRNDIVHQLNDVWMRMTKDEQEEVLKRYQSVSNWKKAVARKINDIIDKKNNITEREQQELIRRTGYRYATVADVLPYLSDFDRDVIELAQMDFGKKFLNKIYDHYLLVHAETGEFADLREFRERFGGVLDSLADDFTIPFVKINPIRLLYLRQFSAAHKPPMFYLLHRETIQPAITKNTQALGRDLLFLDGQVVDLVDLDRVVTENVRLVEGQKGPIARYYRNLVGLSTSKYTAPKSGPRRFLYEVAQLFDVGFQDEPIGRDLGYHFRVGKQSVELPQLTDPTTWPSWVAQKLHNLFRPYEEAQRIRLEHAFGVHAEYIVFNNYRTYEEVGNFKDWIKQFYAGRKDLEHVTTATLFPYGFFERLNATLNQVGLGLSNEKLGSAFDVFWNLVLYRILPVYAIVEAWDYLNYLSDTFLGFQFEDAFAKFYAGASVDIAELRDALGITDWAKHYAHLFPGGDQIAELPLIGRFFQLNMSAEETREYWESGEDPVRKGRYWEFGNCVHPDTLIQLADGRLVPAKDVQVGDEVLTHEGKAEKVLRVTIREMEEGEWAPKIYIHGFPEPIITTDNHPYLAVKQKHCPSNSVVDCRPDRKMKICMQGIYPNYCPKQQEWNAQWTLARYLEEGDYLAYPRIKFSGLITEVDGIPLNQDTGYFLGVFLAEGNISNWENGKAYGIETIHHEDEREIAEKLSEIVEKYFRDKTSQISIKEGKALRWRNGKRCVSQWVEKMVYRGREKVFPPYLDQYPAEFALGLLKGIFEGDGHIDKTGKDSLQMVLTAKRMEHIIAVRNILFAFGIENSVVLHGKGKHTSYRIIVTGDAAKRLYKLIDYRKPCPTSLNLTGVTNKYMYIDDNYVYIKIKSIENSEYFGVVYDYEIENAHSFCGLTVILHNTPFTGGKIEYFQPNWVRRVLSDYKFSNVLYGSREEYFANAPYPTPTHPLAPLRHFLLDPYHWEEKHYYDRPYLLTGGFPEFEEFPLIGPFLNATIGELLKPPVRMHLEYWNAPKDGEVYVALEGGKFVLPDEEGTAASPLDPIGLAAAKTVELRIENEEGKPEAPPAPLALIPSREEVEAEPETRLMAYITASGQIQVAKVPVSAISKLNEKIKEKSLLSVPGTEMLLESDSPTVELPAQPLMLPGSAPATIGNFYYNLTEMGGIYGFGLMTMTGELFREPTIATSTDMTSFRRAFWDLNIGNLGSDANEIFRRFLPKDRRLQEYNPVPNRMPDWLPGEEYFINFQVGDPYTKIPKGEMRLPGEGYERLYNVQVDMDLSLGASYIGYDVPTIINHLLRRDEIKDDEEAYRLKTGEKWHTKFEQELMQKGIAIDFEQYVSDASLNIGGFYDMKVDNLKWLHFVAENASVLKYYPSASAKGALGLEGYEGFFAEPLDYRALPDDAARASMLEDLMSGVGQAIIEIKTMGPERFNQDRMFFEHAQQMNFYLYATGIPRGYLVYINREDIEQGQESELKVYAIDFNPDLLHYSLQKVEAAREYIRQGLETGEITRGDFYSMLDRYRILADVAPYSEEFRQMRRQIRNWQGLDEEALEEVREIEKQVSAKKKSLRLYEYRFKTANIEKHLVTVKEVINNNMFLVEEFDHPIRFAGIYVPDGKDDPKAKQARKLINLEPGDKIVIGIDADELRQVRDDTYRTIAAVVYNKGINVNRALLEAGLAKEKENDFSPAAVHARFTSNEILLGKIWETFAHMDTPYHTKFLQVRSALESYERREVYNKDWQEWSEPFEDYFIPWYQNIIRKEPLLALVTGTMLGSLFGNTRYGKIMGALTGFVLTSLGVAYVSTYEELTGRNWVPERRLREWELFEYLDMIKYVKYRRLYEWAADKALEEEGVDVRKLLAEQKAEGELREAEREYLEDLKRRLVVGDEDERLAAQEEARDLGFEGENLIKAINQRIKELANSREAMPIGPWTARALMYYQMSERTMYGYDPGEPLANFLAALPKKDREYLVPFIQAPEEERDRILEVTPPYIRRVLQAAWGLPVEPKPDLVTYFTQHGLPEPDWIGWDPRASLKDLTVKMVKREKLDPSEFDIWPSDEQQAAYVKMEPPSLHARLSPVEVKRRLEDVLRGLGLEEVYVEVAKKEAADGLDSVDALILKNRQVDIVRKMNEEAANLL